MNGKLINVFQTCFWCHVRVQGLDSIWKGGWTARVGVFTLFGTTLVNIKSGWPHSASIIERLDSSKVLKIWVHLSYIVFRTFHRLNMKALMIHELWILVRSCHSETVSSLRFLPYGYTKIRKTCIIRYWNDLDLQSNTRKYIQCSKWLSRDAICASTR